MIAVHMRTSVSATSKLYMKIQRCGRIRGISSSDITITQTDTPQPKTPNEELKFGNVSSDHMLTIQWRKNTNWETPQIRPTQNLSLSPAASCLHYGLQCFEGMKAYKAVDDTIRLFRPDKNMARLRRSMEVLRMPTDDWRDEELLECIKELVRVDKSWIPEGEGYSLYLRPTCIATHPFLGLAPPDEVLLYCITSPVGPYYTSGFQPVRLTADTKQVRAWPGGTGNSKVGGNYGPTMKPAAEAAERGYQQVLWLFDDTITEVGAMNVFFVLLNKETGEKEIITAPLTRGDILPGVTRLSILDLARNWTDYKVVERFLTMTEVRNAASDGRLLEAFGAGTAAVVVPVSCIEYQGQDIDIPNTTGEVTKRVWDQITGIQYGKIQGPDDTWSVVV
mmetsp:Transcript_11685/g.17615  ORF Transcript_11685/g.17615 Transcript_11685/m.17615 type:complete len:392 (-) Transcript_11685:168-1343(-)|eukprot:CAMPEP_0196803204 /NCGR_PEP_ID=MMETSP1362-20130617/2592_1 /TAXON_ID=163516 /ORGANISM="Leptocylindrus danicus, Strain CCMP1856" /LENGTH=391 /DNA_ID=CAMNT_0042174657 /DNA_START=42 /DNA_END=1217 /DNA_ORIENTATION=-